MCMIDDAEGWKCSSTSAPVARKQHRCGECGRIIEPGETYHRLKGLDYESEGWTDAKTCAHCNAVASWLQVQCGGWLINGVLEDLEEHWREEDLLRGQYLGRAILNMRRRWRDRAGELVPIPDKFKALVPA